MSMVVDPKAKSNGMDLSWLGKPQNTTRDVVQPDGRRHGQLPRRFRSAAAGAAGEAAGRDEGREHRRAGLFAGANIRYATASYQGNWKYNINIRYAVVPAEGKPSSSRPPARTCSAQDRPPWMEGRIRPAITGSGRKGDVPCMAGRMADSVVEVLSEHGVEKEKIGIDNLDMPAYEAFQKAGLEDCERLAAVSRARTVKTRDEIEPLKPAWRASATRRCGRSSMSG